MQEALKYFDDEVRLFKELYEANPRSETLKNGLAISYEKLGSIHQSMGHRKEALQYFEQRTVLGKELYEANPLSASLAFGLATAYIWLGWTYEKKEDNFNANKEYSFALPIIEKLCLQTPIPEYTSQLNWLKQAIERIK